MCNCVYKNICKNLFDVTCRAVRQILKFLKFC